MLQQEHIKSQILFRRILNEYTQFPETPYGDATF